MASNEEVQNMMKLITKIKNDVETRLNTAMDLMEKNLDLDLKHKQLLQDRKSELAIAEQLLSEKFEAQFQKQFKEYRRKLEQDIRRQLKNQGDELKMLLQIEVLKIREMFSTMHNGNIESHEQLFNRDEEGIKTSVTTATNNLKRPETKGTYENWDFVDDEVFDLIPVTEMKKILTELDKLDVTIKADKVKGLALIYQLMTTSKSIIVTKNRRFPIQGRYYNRGCRFSTKNKINYISVDLRDLYCCLEFIDNDYTDRDYNVLKSLVFDKFTECSNDDGFVGECAFQIATRDLTSIAKKPLLDYLTLLCYFVNIEKIYCMNGLKAPSIASFEKQYDLTWKEVQQ